MIEVLDRGEEDNKIICIPVVDRGMAKILDIPIGTVRSRLHRARHLLKDTLKSYAQSMGYGRDEEED